MKVDVALPEELPIPGFRWSIEPYDDDNMKVEIQYKVAPGTWAAGWGDLVHCCDDMGAYEVLEEIDRAITDVRKEWAEEVEEHRMAAAASALARSTSSLTVGPHATPSFTGETSASAIAFWSVVSFLTAVPTKVEEAFSALAYKLGNPYSTAMEKLRTRSATAAIRRSLEHNPFKAL